MMWLPNLHHAGQQLDARGGGQLRPRRYNFCSYELELN
jgi:hypothetical protein